MLHAYMVFHHYVFDTCYFLEVCVWFPVVMYLVEGCDDVLGMVQHHWALMVAILNMYSINLYDYFLN